MNNLSKNNTIEISDSNRANKNNFFNENDLKLSENKQIKKDNINNELSKENNNNIFNNLSLKDTNFSTKTKNSFINNLSMSNTSSNTQLKTYSNDITIKKENLKQGLNNLNSYSNYENEKLNYKNLKDEINKLKKENEILKKNIEENNNKEVSEELTNELIDLKNKLSEYDSSIEIIKTKYNEEINNLKFQIREYNSYIHLTYLFFHNITNNALTSLNFNIEKQNNILISLEEFQQKLNQIETFMYDILKDNSNLKIKYYKLLELDNNKLNNEINEDELLNNNIEKQNISNNNIVNDSYITSISNFTMAKKPENIFENNYENFQSKKNSELNIFERRDSNSLQNKGTLEIYKTLEQRLNILEKELNIQRNYNNYNNNDNNSNLQIFNTVNPKNDTIVGKIRSRSGNKIVNNKHYESQDYSQIDNNNSEKPKKNIKKKKKGGMGKISINSNNNNNNNKNQKINNNKNINRSITPIQNRKTVPSYSNNKNINTAKSKK